MLVSALLSASLVGYAAAIAVPAHYNLHERRHSDEGEWIRQNRVHSDALLPVRIGLTQSNLDRGHDMLMEVSDPTSPKYGQHYSADEIIDIFAPSDETVEAVKEWLVSDGGFHIDRISLSVNKQWLQIDAKSHELESLLHNEYHIYEHAGNGKRNVAADEYHVPAHVQRHIDYITPGVLLLADNMQPASLTKRDASNPKPLPFAPKTSPFPAPLNVIQAMPQAERCTKVISPDCVRTLYNFTVGTTAVKGNSMGIYETGNEFYSQADLNQFYATYAKQIANGTAPIVNRVDGGVARGESGGESILDLDCSVPIVWPQNVTYFAVDDFYYNSHAFYEGLFNTFLDSLDGSYCNYTAFGETGDRKGGKGLVPLLDPPYPDPHPRGYNASLQCGKYKPTNVISISYSLTEFYTPMGYQRRQCNEFMKLGMQGVSVVVATGDYGVANPKYLGPFSDDGCLFGNKSNYPMKPSFKKPVFNPGFPVTCPYITTVGSTYLPPGASVDQDGEVATTSFASGAGFSNIYPIPSYQANAVATYFKNYAPSYPYYETTYNKSFGANNGVYNRAGRGFPDVSAVGDNIATVAGGALQLSGGTSASAPIFGAILNRINEERLLAKKSPIGFVNPALYANPQVLHDITVGSSFGCNTKGFNASKGWDPVTGLGTPNFPAMLKLFMSLS